jgi:hypothetical protein
VSLAIAPSDPDEIVASGERRVFRSGNGGRSWRPVDAPAAGLLSWNRQGVFLVGGDGRVWRADSAAGPWDSTGGNADGQPAAWDSGPDDELLVALHDGTVKQSVDGGRSWTIRSRPG